MTEPHPLQAVIDQYLLYAFFPFLMLIIWGIIDSHRRWNRIAVPFRTRMKFKHADDNVKISIDGRMFKNLRGVAVEQGLYFAHWGLLPQIIMPKRVLIPWRSLSNIYTKKRTALGFTIEEYFVKTSGGTTVELEIPRDLAEEILNKNFLKQD